MNSQDLGFVLSLILAFQETVKKYSLALSDVNRASFTHHKSMLGCPVKPSKQKTVFSQTNNGLFRGNLLKATAGEIDAGSCNIVENRSILSKNYSAR